MSEQSGGSDFFHESKNKDGKPCRYVYRGTGTGSHKTIYEAEEANRIFGIWEEPFVEDEKLLWRDVMDEVKMPDLHEARKERKPIPLDDGLKQAEMPDLSEVRKKNKDVPEYRVPTDDDFLDSEAARDMRCLSGVKCKIDKKKRKEEKNTYFPWTLEGNNVSALRSGWLRMKELGKLNESGLPIYLQNIVEGAIDSFDVEVNNFCKLAGLKYKTEKEDLLVEAAGLKSLCSEVMKRVDLLVENYNQRGVRND
jgi:hypothetical protein